MANNSTCTGGYITTWGNDALNLPIECIPSTTSDSNTECRSFQKVSNEQSMKGAGGTHGICKDDLDWIITIMKISDLGVWVDGEGLNTQDAEGMGFLIQAGHYYIRPWQFGYQSWNNGRLQRFSTSTSSKKVTHAGGWDRYEYDPMGEETSNTGNKDIDCTVTGTCDTGEVNPGRQYRGRGGLKCTSQFRMGLVTDAASHFDAEPTSTPSKMNLEYNQALICQAYNRMNSGYGKDTTAENRQYQCPTGCWPGDVEAGNWNWSYDAGCTLANVDDITTWKPNEYNNDIQEQWPGGGWDSDELADTFLDNGGQCEINWTGTSDGVPRGAWGQCMSETNGGGYSIPKGFGTDGESGCYWAPYTDSTCGAAYGGCGPGCFDPAKEDYYKWGMTPFSDKHNNQMGCKLTSAVGNLSAVAVSSIDPFTKLDITQVQYIDLRNAADTAASAAWTEWGEDICTEWIPSTNCSDGSLDKLIIIKNNLNLCGPLYGKPAFPSCFSESDIHCIEISFSCRSGQGAGCLDPRACNYDPTTAGCYYMDPYPDPDVGVWSTVDYIATNVYYSYYVDEHLGNSIAGLIWPGNQRCIEITSQRNCEMCWNCEWIDWTYGLPENETYSHPDWFTSFCQKKEDTLTAEAFDKDFNIHTQSYPDDYVVDTFGDFIGGDVWGAANVPGGGWDYCQPLLTWQQVFLTGFASGTTHLGDFTCCIYETENYDCDGSCKHQNPDGEYTVDCCGNCGGNCRTDDCEICAGGNFSVHPEGETGYDGTTDFCLEYNGGVPNQYDEWLSNEYNYLVMRCDEMDCSGECDGVAALDDCFICGGLNEDKDCAGVCFGAAITLIEGPCAGMCYCNYEYPAEGYGCLQLPDANIDDCDICFKEQGDPTFPYSTICTQILIDIDVGAYTGTGDYDPTNTDSICFGWGECCGCTDELSMDWDDTHTKDCLCNLATAPCDTLTEDECNRCSGNGNCTWGGSVCEDGSTTVCGYQEGWDHCCRYKGCPDQNADNFGNYSLFDTIYGTELPATSPTTNDKCAFVSLDISDDFYPLTATYGGGVCSGAEGYCCIEDDTAKCKYHGCIDTNALNFYVSMDDDSFPWSVVAPNQRGCSQNVAKCIDDSSCDYGCGPGVGSSRIDLVYPWWGFPDYDPAAEDASGYMVRCCIAWPETESCQVAAPESVCNLKITGEDQYGGDSGLFGQRYSVVDSLCTDINGPYAYQVCGNCTECEWGTNSTCVCTDENTNMDLGITEDACNLIQCDNDSYGVFSEADSCTPVDSAVANYCAVGVTTGPMGINATALDNGGTGLNGNFCSDSQYSNQTDCEAVSKIWWAGFSGQTEFPYNWNTWDYTTGKVLFDNWKTWISPNQLPFPTITTSLGEPFGYNADDACARYDTGWNVTCNEITYEDHCNLCSTNCVWTDTVCEDGISSWCGYIDDYVWLNISNDDVCQYKYNACRDKTACNYNPESEFDCISGIPLDEDRGDTTCCEYPNIIAAMSGCPACIDTAVPMSDWNIPTTPDPAWFEEWTLPGTGPSTYCEFDPTGCSNNITGKKQCFENLYTPKVCCVDTSGTGNCDPTCTGRTYWVTEICGWDDCGQYGTEVVQLLLTERYAINPQDPDLLRESNTLNLDTCGCKKCAEGSLDNGGSPGYVWWGDLDGNFEPNRYYVPCSPCCTLDENGAYSGTDTCNEVFTYHDEALCLDISTIDNACTCDIPHGYDDDREQYWLDDDCDGVGSFPAGEFYFCPNDVEINIWDPGYTEYIYNYDIDFDDIIDIQTTCPLYVKAPRCIDGNCEISGTTCSNICDDCDGINSIDAMELGCPDQGAPCLQCLEDQESECPNMCDSNGNYHSTEWYGTCCDCNCYTEENCDELRTKMVIDGWDPIEDIVLCEYPTQIPCIDMTYFVELQGGQPVDLTLLDIDTLDQHVNKVDENCRFSCLDRCQVCFGSNATEDACGVCSGTAQCNNSKDGSSVNMTGVPLGFGTTFDSHPEGKGGCCRPISWDTPGIYYNSDPAVGWHGGDFDCNGSCGGIAQLDLCNICAGGLSTDCLQGNAYASTGTGNVTGLSPVPSEHISKIDVVRGCHTWDEETFTDTCEPNWAIDQCGYCFGSNDTQVSCCVDIQSETEVDFINIRPNESVNIDGKSFKTFPEINFEFTEFESTDGKLIHYWKLDENSGPLGTTVYDVFGQHGTIQYRDESGNNGNPAWNEGFIFDGDGIHIQINDLDYPTDSFTVSGWFKTNASGNYECTKPTGGNGAWCGISNYSSFILGPHTGNVMGWIVRPASWTGAGYGSTCDEGGTAYATYTHTPNIWNHWQGTYDSVKGQLKFYLNGTLNSTCTNTNLTNGIVYDPRLAIGARECCIGDGDSGENYTSAGEEIRDVKIYEGVKIPPTLHTLTPEGGKDDVGIYEHTIDNLGAVAAGGGAYTFEGSDYIETDYIPDITNGATMMYWFKPDNLTIQQMMGCHQVSTNNRFYAGIRFDGGVQKAFYGVGDLHEYVTDISSDLTVGSWVHLTLTYNGATAKYYINGKEVTSLTVGDQTANTPITTFRIGSVEAGFNMAGQIKDVRVYESTLTQDEIVQIIGNDINTVLSTDNFHGLGQAGSLDGFRLVGDDGTEYINCAGVWQEGTSCS